MDINDLVTYLLTPVAQIALIMALAEVAKRIAEVQGNVIKLEHNQFVTTNRSAQVELRITLEAFGSDHKQQIMDALEKGNYKPKLVRTSL